MRTPTPPQYVGRGARAVPCVDGLFMDDLVSSNIGFKVARSPMRSPWTMLRLGDLAAIALFVAIIGVVGVLAFYGLALGKFPGPSNWGFGADWECTYPGRGDPVCLKRSPQSK